MTVNERTKIMLAEYGEACTQAQAARLLNHAPKTIHQMVADGRLRSACGGTRIDVRSIAEYIMAPSEKDSSARLIRARRSWTV